MCCPRLARIFADDPMDLIPLPYEKIEFELHLMLRHIPFSVFWIDLAYVETRTDRSVSEILAKTVDAIVRSLVLIGHKTFET